MDETNPSTAQLSETPAKSADSPAQNPDVAARESSGGQNEVESLAGVVATGGNPQPEAEDDALSLPEAAALSGGVINASLVEASGETPVSASAAIAESAEVSPAESVVVDEPVAAKPVEPEPQPTRRPLEPVSEPLPEVQPKSDKMDWYILKVQSNREESVREGLRKKIKIAGLERYFGEIIIPTEKVTEFKGGKRKVFKRKLYPGYLVVQMEINEDTWFLVRETTGIGDFTGAGGHPTPMQPHEVAAILAKQEEKADEAPKLKIAFRVGDHVKIKEGTFENFEGEVANIDETNGRVTVLINIFGRSTPVDIEYWQIESV